MHENYKWIVYLLHCLRYSLYFIIIFVCYSFCSSVLCFYFLFFCVSCNFNIYFSCTCTCSFSSYYPLFSLLLYSLLSSPCFSSLPLSSFIFISSLLCFHFLFFSATLFLLFLFLSSYSSLLFLDYHLFLIFSLILFLSLLSFYLLSYAHVYCLGVIVISVCVYSVWKQHPTPPISSHWHPYWCEWWRPRWIRCRIRNQLSIRSVPLFILFSDMHFAWVSIWDSFLFSSLFNPLSLVFGMLHNIKRVLIIW